MFATEAMYNWVLYIYINFRKTEKTNSRFGFSMENDTN